MSTNDSKLFSSIKYFTTGFREPSLETTLKQNGAIRSFYLTATTTHVICDDFDSNKGELEQAIEIYQTPIVNSDWVAACLKCNALLPIDPFRNTEHHLFHSCTFANANLSNEDHNKIYALVTFYGGRWATNLDDPNCTHIICASALPSTNSEDETTNNHRNIDERLQTAYEIQSEKKIHLITPDWLVDCINANRRLEESTYHPDLLRDPNEPMDVDEDELDDEQNTSMNNQSTDEQTPTKTSTSIHRSQLITKNFFNQADQTSPPPSTEPLLAINDSSNPPDLSDTSQPKPFPPKRSRARPAATNPRQRNTKLNSTTNPNLHTNQNGHSSTMKDGPQSTLPIEEKLIRPSISASLFNNKTNSQISRHPPPETLSYELNFCLQDKLELVPSSQCLVGCVIYIHEQEYISLISNDDLSSWSKTIVDHGAILTDDIHHNDLTHFLCAYRTSELFRQVCKRKNVRMVTAYWLNDVLQRKKLFVPNLALHYPCPFDPHQPEKLPLMKYYFTLTGFEGIERARLRYMIRALGGKYSGHLSKWHTHLIAREQGKSNKFKKASQWLIPIVNGLWLSELYLGNTCALKQPLEERYKRLSGTPPIDHFSFDQIFVHDLLLPWSQPIRITDENLNGAIRRHNEQAHIQHPESNLDHIKNSFHYTQPMMEVPPINDQSFSIMLSGFNRKTLNYYETIIKSLGGQISTLPHTTTHLIMNRFLRTEKFYECMNYVKYVLNQTWLDKCNEGKCFVSIDASDWIVIQEECSSKENFIQQAIDKRINRQNRLLFENSTFYLTPSIQLSLKSIIFASGGHIRRELPFRNPSNEQMKMNDCWILSCQSDQILFKDFHSLNNRLLSTEFLLRSILHQEILNIDSFLLQI